MIASQPQSVPLHVVTGFLGSGKTTLIRRFLAEANEHIAVLINEVGDFGIDGHLVEHIDEDLLLLPGGCICCSMRDGLYNALNRLIARKPARVILETSGMVDPAPLLHTIATDPLFTRLLTLRSVVCVVDAMRYDDICDSHPEFLRQLDFSDRVVLTKTDEAAHKIDDVTASLAERAQGKEIWTSAQLNDDWAWMTNPSKWSEAALKFDKSTLTPDAVHLPYRTHRVEHDKPVDLDAVKLWLRLVAQIDGLRLTRIKGIVRCRESDACFVLQSANRAISPPIKVTGKPCAGAQFVLIEHSMPPAAMNAVLEALRSALENI